MIEFSCKHASHTNKGNIVANIETPAPVPATEAVDSPKFVRLSGNVSPELSDWLTGHRFDERKEKNEFLEFVLMKYAVAHGFQPSKV